MANAQKDPTRQIVQSNLAQRQTMVNATNPKEQTPANWARIPSIVHPNLALMQTMVPATNPVDRGFAKREPTQWIVFAPRQTMAFATNRKEQANAHQARTRSIANRVCIAPTTSTILRENCARILRLCTMLSKRAPVRVAVKAHAHPRSASINCQTLWERAR